MRILWCFDFQVNYVLHWWFHFRNEIPINDLFTRWKCTYILDLRPWRWSALNMGFVVKRPSRMQEQYFFVFGRGGQLFSGGFEKIPGGGINFAGGGPRPDLTPPIVRRGVLSVHHSPWGRLHEISAFFGLEAGLNYTL